MRTCGNRPLKIHVIAASSNRRAELAGLAAEGATARITTSPRVSLDQIRQAGAEMILVDVNDRGIFEESITLVESLPLGMAVVLLVDHSNPRRIKQAIHAGVRGILSRDVSAGEIGLAISAAETGLILLQPTFAVLLGRSDPSGPNSLPDPIEVLTTREHEILMLMSEGLGNKQIAARLQLSEYTVKFHVSSILSKLHADSRTEAVSLGVKRGWIFL